MAAAEGKGSRGGMGSAEGIGADGEEAGTWLIPGGDKGNATTGVTLAPGRRGQVSLLGACAGTQA